MEDLKLKVMTHAELMTLGLDQVAYVRTHQNGDKNIFHIYAADGTKLAETENEHEARVLILKSDMKQTTLH